MKLTLNQKSARKGFTLIEMIGVLAVIAILASLLIPKIFNAINDAKVANTILSYNTMKTAVADHYGKFGAFDKTANGATLSGTGLTGYDHTLLTEGLVDKPFFIKIGTTSWVEVVTAPPGAVPPAGFDLSAGGLTNDVLGASFLVEAVILGLSASDAKDINDRLDGTTGGFATTLGGPDGTGRVKYTNTAGGIAWIYITHR